MTLSTDKVDWQLDATKKLTFNNGDFVWTSGSAAVAQAISIEVNMLLGEWFANLDRGVPYFETATVPATQAILGQPFNAAKIQGIFAKIIKAVPDVVQILNITAVQAGNVCSITWTVLTAFDDTITGSASSAR